MSIEFAGTCANCGQGLMTNDDDVRVVGKDIYCNIECLRNAGVSICDECGDYIDIEDKSYGAYSEIYCEKCFNELDEEDQALILNANNYEAPKSIFIKIRALLNEASDLFNMFSTEIQDKCIKFHNDNATLNHCLRWGTQAVDEIVKEFDEFMKQQ